MSDSKQAIDPSDPIHPFREKLEFQIARYEQLQQAWMKRIEIEYQLIGVTLVLMGTALSVGLEYSKWVLLLYPLVAVCLGVICLDNNIKLTEIKKLTGDHDEKQFPLPPIRAIFKRWMGLAVLVLIVNTEFVSVILAMLYYHPKIAEDIGWYILFILAALTSLVGLYLVYYMYTLCVDKYKAP